MYYIIILFKKSEREIIEHTFSSFNRSIDSLNPVLFREYVGGGVMDFYYSAKYSLNPLQIIKNH